MATYLSSCVQFAAFCEALEKMRMMTTKTMIKMRTVKAFSLFFPRKTAASCITVSLCGSIIAAFCRQDRWLLYFYSTLFNQQLSTPCEFNGRKARNGVDDFISHGSNMARNVGRDMQLKRNCHPLRTAPLRTRDILSFFQCQPTDESHEELSDFLCFEVDGEGFSTPKGWMLLKKTPCFFLGGLFCICSHIYIYNNMNITWYLLHHIVSALVVVALFSDSSLQISIYSYSNASLSKNACSLYATTPNVQPISQATRPSRLGPSAKSQVVRRVILWPGQNCDTTRTTNTTTSTLANCIRSSPSLFRCFFLRFPAPQHRVRCTFYRFFHSFMV